MLLKEEIRQLKARTVQDTQAALPQFLKDHPEIAGTDQRIVDYVSAVVNNPDEHNVYEILGVERFMYLVGKYAWNTAKVKHFIRFYEALRFSGLEGRRQYKLTPVQTFIFANIFGLRRKDGRRLIRNAYLFVPRKFSKTTSIASLAVYDMLFGDNNAQAYVGANSYDQAKICFDEIRNIMRDIDPRERHMRINRERIFFTDRGRDSLIRCLTSNAKTGDGLNASLAIMDEYAQARDTAGRAGAELKNVLTSSMGARKEPLTVIMTTASDVLDGPFVRELDGVYAVLRKEVVNDSLFAIIFQPDVDDEEADPKTWKKVQPHLGITVQADYYEQAWANAQLSADNMMTFRTKLLNVFTKSQRDSWISAELATEASIPMDIRTLQGRPDAMCAIDLSEKDDFSAVTFGIYRESEKTFWFHTAYFFPEGALRGHPNEHLYRLWSDQGHLTLLPGNVIDYRAIVDYIIDMNRSVTILRIGYDQWKSLEVINMLGAAGAKNVLLPVSQTYGNFTAPVESFEHGISAGRIFLNDNPINAYCFGNAILDEDHLENKKPVKRTQNQKIDGVITTLMCQRLFIDYER